MLEERQTGSKIEETDNGKRGWNNRYRESKILKRQTETRRWNNDR
jgi:hypothetical protein